MSPASEDTHLTQHADAMPVQGSRRIQGGGTLVRFVTPAALVGDRDRSSWTRSSPLSLQRLRLEMTLGEPSIVLPGSRFSTAQTLNAVK